MNLTLIFVSVSSNQSCSNRNSTSKWKKYLFKRKQSTLTQHARYGCGKTMNRLVLHQWFRWGTDAHAFILTHGWGWRGAWPQAEVNAASTLRSMNQKTITDTSTRLDKYLKHTFICTSFYIDFIYIYILLLENDKTFIQDGRKVRK